MWAGLRETTMRRIEAAQQRLPPSAAFSGLTAAWLHGIDVFPCEPIEASVAPDVPVYRRSGLRLRRVALCEADVVDIRGLRVTRVVRTLADACSWLPLVDAVVLLDVALHRRRIRVNELSDAAGRLHGRRGVARFTRAIALANPAAESPMESRLRMLLILAGLPAPHVQVSIRDPHNNFAGRVDLYYPDHRLAIEYDGASHRDSLVADDRRQNRLQNAGVRLLRFTASDVLRNPDAVIRDVRLAMGSSRSGTAPR